MASCGPEHGCVAILQQADGSTVYSPHFRSWLRHILRTNHVQTLCRQSSNESRAFCANTMTAVELLRPSSNPGGQHRRVWDAVGACELLRCSILLHDQRCHTAGEDVIPCAASACAPPLAVPGYSFLSMDVLCNPGQAEDGRVRARGRMMRDVHNMARILRETFVGILDRLQDACSSVEGFHPPVTPMILEVVRACSSVLQSHDQRWRLDTGPLVKSRAYGFLAGHYRSLEGLVAPGHQSLEALARNSHGAYQGPPCHMMQRLHSILTQFMALHTLRIFERDSALADGRRILQTLVDRTQAFLSDLAGIPDGFRPRPEGRDIIVVTRDEPAEFFYYQPPALVSATDPARSRVLQERCRITAPMYCVSIPPEGDGAVAARWDAFLGTAQATLGSSHAGRVGLLQLRLAVNMVWFAGQNRLPRGLFERTMDLFLTVQRLVPMGPAHLHGLGLSAEQAQALAMDECFFLLPVSQTIPVEVLTLDQPFRGYCIAGMPTAHAGGPFFSPTTPVSTEGAYRKSIALAGNAQNDGLLILCRVHEDMHARGDRKRSPSQRIYHKGERRRPRPTRPDTPQGGPPLPCPDTPQGAPPLPCPDTPQGAPPLPCPDTPQDAPSPLSYSNALTGSRPLSPNEDVWCLREQSHSFCSTPPTAGVWDPHEGDRVEGMWAGVEEEEICDPSTWLQCSRGASPPAAAPVPPERCRELFAEGILACHSGDQARLYDFLVLVLAFVRGIGRLDYGHALESLFQLSSQVLPGMEAFVPCDAGAPTACLYSEARICVAERLWPAMWSPPGVNASPDAPSRASFCDDFQLTHVSIVRAEAVSRYGKNTLEVDFAVVPQPNARKGQEKTHVIPHARPRNVLFCRERCDAWRGGQVGKVAPGLCSEVERHLYPLLLQAMLSEGSRGSEGARNRQGTGGSACEDPWWPMQITVALASECTLAVTRHERGVLSTARTSTGSTPPCHGGSPARCTWTASCEGDARIGVQQALGSFFDRSHEQDQGFTLTLRGVGLARGATDGRVREELHCNVLVMLSREDLLAGPHYIAK